MLQAYAVGRGLESRTLSPSKKPTSVDVNMADVTEI